MITMVRVLDVGNALRLFLQPPQGASQIRLLRKISDDFTGADDSGATIVGDDGKYILPLIVQYPVAFTDVQGLVNGQVYYYRPYYWVSGAWTTDASVTATPAANYYRVNPEPLDILRTRLGLGLANEVTAGRLRHKTGAIPVLNAPPQFEDTPFPVVSVHLQNDAPEVRGIGDQITAWDDEGDDRVGGWLARHQIDVMAWSLNPDERIALRQALKRIVIANLAVFDQLGVEQIEFSQSDSEDLQSYNAPVYMAQGLFSCLVAFEVDAGHFDDEITTITAEANYEQ